MEMEGWLALMEVDQLGTTSNCLASLPTYAPPPLHALQKWCMAHSQDTQGGIHNEVQGEALPL